ncbi:hypothetical protein J4458_00520 [Candidatus Woesearchaeota archaeon]|nr:hypothetical protein [Candidatus Woesearchaeota archaeon]
MKKTNKIALYFLLIFIIVVTGCAKKEKFGPLNSAHQHADFKVYILGNALDFSRPQYMVKHDLTHVENNDGDVLHTHATGIALGFFLKTLNFEIDNECIKVDAGNKYCSLGSATLKVYLNPQGGNWEQLYSPADYVINDLDKILVTYGAESEEEIRKQQESVTDKAKDY